MSVNSIQSLPVLKKALTFATVCGAGNTKAAESIERALKSKWQDLEVVHTKNFDHIWPGGKWSLYKIHLFFAKKGWYRVCNFGQSIIKPLLEAPLERYENYFRKKIDEEHPDILISTNPMINRALINIGREKNIPVLIVSADYDTENYSSGFDCETEDKGGYKYCIPSSCYETALSLNPAIHPSRIQVSGYAVRPEFEKRYSEEEKALFREELGISSQLPMSLFMMGSLGGEAIEEYFEEVLKSEDLLGDFVFLCGNNKELKEKLEKWLQDLGYTRNGNFYENTENNKRFSMVGFTDEVYKYLSASDCFITKTGSSSIAEGLSQRKPMLLDCVKGNLDWEAANIDIIEQNGLGDSVKKYSSFASQLKDVLKRKDSISQQYETFCLDKEDQFTFQRNIIRITEDLLQETSSRKIEEKPSIINCKNRFYNLVIVVNFVKIVWNKFVGWIKDTFSVLSHQFFSGFYSNVKSKMLKERRQMLLSSSEFNAKPMEMIFSKQNRKVIDTIHIKSKSPNRTGNVIILALGKVYQKFNPDNYRRFLDKGVDVILFNPTEYNSMDMASDLGTIIDATKQRMPEAKIAVHGYCIGAHAAMGELSQRYEDIPLVCDRGFADSYDVAKKYTHGVAKLAKKRIYRYYNVCDKDALKKYKGNILFLSPSQGKDFMLHKGKKINFTKDIYSYRSHDGDEYYDLGYGSTHWSRLDEKAKDQIEVFLEQNGIIPSSLEESQVV
jgi:UDP-N-acetylglucosamine:LPS N-acetylglucosamine transferase